jgi:hypothetical protein
MFWTDYYKVNKIRSGIEKSGGVSDILSTAAIQVPLILAGISGTAGFLAHDAKRSVRLMDNLHKVRMDKLNDYLEDLDAQQTFFRYKKKRKEKEKNRD